MKTSTKIFFARIVSIIIRTFFKFIGKNYKQLVVKRNQILFLLDLREGIDFAIFLNYYEQKVVNYYSKIIKPNFVIIDIGSNIGFHTLNFAKLSPKGRVYSIEPTNFAYNKLKININLNLSLKKLIITEQIFLSKSNKKKNTFAYASWPLIKTNNEIHPILMAQKKEIKQAKFQSLDKYITSKRIKKINIIKIDVDGNEYNVLIGSLNTIKKFKPIIIFEFCPYLHKDKNLNLILNIFKKLKYKFMDVSNLKILNFKDSKELGEYIKYGSGKNFFLIPE